MCSNSIHEGAIDPIERRRLCKSYGGKPLKGTVHPKEWDVLFPWWCIWPGNSCSLPQHNRAHRNWIAVHFLALKSIGMLTTCASQPIMSTAVDVREHISSTCLQSCGHTFYSNIFLCTLSFCRVCIWASLIMWEIDLPCGRDVFPPSIKSKKAKPRLGLPLSLNACDGGLQPHN